MSDSVKALEIASKFAWPTFVITALIIFAPSDHLIGINFSELRTHYPLELQLGLMFSAIIAVGSAFPSRKNLWQFVFCPLKKILFPMKDIRTGVKQSRMRYREIAIIYGDREIVYLEEADSNGYPLSAYYDRSGRRAIPTAPYDGQIALGDWIHTPDWGRIDRKDLFNGNGDSGMWAITERQ